MTDNPSFLDSPVFLCGAPRSGTTLLHGLFDGVPGLMSLPIENCIGDKFYEYRKFGPELLRNYFLRDYIWNFELQILYNADYYQFVTDRAVKRFGDQPTKQQDAPCEKFTGAFQSTYQEYLSKHKELTIDLPFKALALTHCLNLYKLDPNQQTHFVHRRNLFNETQAAELDSAFTNARFVHLLRDPRTRYLSSRERAIRKTTSRLGRYIGRSGGIDHVSHRSIVSMYSFELARRNRILLKDRYLVIRYEDLADDREATMARIAEFIGIPFSPNLLVPTQFGEKTGGNSSFRQSVQDIEKSVSDRVSAFEKATSSLERKIIYYYVSRIAKEFGYDLPVIDSVRGLQRIQKIKYEHWFDYLNNRASSLRLMGSNHVYLHNLQYEKMLKDILRGQPIDM